MVRTLSVTYTRSAIGRRESQRRTIAALGLKRINQTVRLPDNQSVRGMIHTVRHLVTWSEVEEGTGV